MSDLRIFTRNTGLSAGNTVAVHYPLYGKGQPVYYWAERGKVSFRSEREDQTPDQRFGQISWQDAANRVLSLSEMMRNKTHDSGQDRKNWSAERRRQQNFICDMEKVLKEARAQTSKKERKIVVAV